MLIFINNSSDKNTVAPLNNKSFELHESTYTQVFSMNIVSLFSFCKS